MSIRTSFLTLSLLAVLPIYAQGINADRSITDVQITKTPNGNIQLSWSPVPTASGYKIYHANHPGTFGNGEWKPAARVTTTSYSVAASDNPEFFCVTWDNVPNGTGNFVLVEGGTFNNGASDVTISTFYMSKYELTQGEYQSVTGTNPSYHPLDYGIGPNYPVWYVTWFDAVLYCNLRSIQEGMTPCYSYAGFGTNPADWPADWITQVMNMQQNVFCNWTASGYRLPTEMEWQYAARGGIYSHGYTYSGSDNFFEVGYNWQNWGYNWYTPHSVGGKAANEIGIYDMSGNLIEWTWDIPADYPTTPQTDPHGPDFLHYQRTLRGGAINNNATYPCAVDYRNWVSANASSMAFGFRICRLVP